MKKSEALDWGMRGIIELMDKEQDKNKRTELAEALKELAILCVLEERQEQK